MSFTSSAHVVVLGEVDHVYQSFSTKCAFLDLVKLSPTTDSIEVLKSDTVSLNRDLEYHCGSAADSEETCDRFHFKLVEKVKYLGVSVAVIVLGTQIMSRNQRLHLYESSANDGKVKIRKVRRFQPHVDSETKIVEVIDGKTSWLLSGFVGKEARTAHAAHVAKYGELIK